MEVLSKSGRKTKPRNACQISAYVSGNTVKDELRGHTYSDTSKEEVTHTGMFFADRVLEEWRSQSAIWNAVEQFEKNNSTAQLCRHLDIALPNEFNSMQMKETADEFCKQLMEKYNYPFVQYGIHEKEATEDKVRNFHMHILVPTRDIDKDGNFAIKQRNGYVCQNIETGEKRVLELKEFNELHEKDKNWERVPFIDKKTNMQKVDSRNRKQWKKAKIEKCEWDNKDHLKNLRLEWQNVHNEKVKKFFPYNYQDMLIDCRSYKDRGIDLQPTKHRGKKLEYKYTRKLDTSVYDISGVRRSNLEITIRKIINLYIDVKNKINRIKLNRNKQNIIRQYPEYSKLKTVLENTDDIEKLKANLPRWAEQYVNSQIQLLNDFSDVIDYRDEYKMLIEDIKTFSKEYNPVKLEDVQELDRLTDELAGASKCIESELSDTFIKQMISEIDEGKAILKVYDKPIKKSIEKPIEKPIQDKEPTEPIQVSAYAQSILDKAAKSVDHSHSKNKRI